MFVGTMLVGPNETDLERALQSFRNAGVDRIFTLIDTISPERRAILEQYECQIIHDKWDYNWGRSRTILQKALPIEATWQLWLDDDDEITQDDGAKIKAVSQTEPDRTIHIPYVYIEDNSKTFRLDRARLFPARDVIWQHHAHESPVFPVDYRNEYRRDIAVYHHRGSKEIDRPQKIITGLELDLKEDTDNPRILFYLGQTSMELGNSGQAGHYYERYLLAGGWDEERMTACIHLSNLYQHHMKDNPTSLMYALRAKSEVSTDRREAYQRIGEIYFAMNDMESAYKAFMYETSIPYPEDAKMFVQNHLYKATPHIWLLFVCNYLHKTDEFKYHLIEASKHNPTDPNVLKYHDRMGLSPKKTTIPYAIKTRVFTQKLKKAFGSRPIVGVEIGVNQANNALEMLEELNIKKLYLIDPYEYYDGYNDNAGDLVAFEKYAHERLKRYDDKIVWIKKQSSDAIGDIPDNLDFVYVDGNHEYLPVLEDLKKYYPKIRIGGYIGGDDIFEPQSFNGRFGVLPALKQFCLERGLVSESDDRGVNFWINRKPVAFFHVGYSCERWTSQSIHTTGIGGRETSNVNMAKEMQDLGWQVVLFADCAGQEGIYDGILHIDYRKFSDYCKDWVPDVVFISMRYSILDNDFPAKNIVFWAHDMHFGKSLEEWPDYPTSERLAKCDYFFFMSPFQKKYLQKNYDMPESKSYLTRSGIVPELFMHKNIKRNRHRMIYSSSPDRGLERLLQWWPELKQAIPELELHVFYGFLNMLQAAKKDPPDVAEQKITWVNGLKDTMDELAGVYYHDRIPQEKLAREFLESSLWGYSTAFFETMCELPGSLIFTKNGMVPIEAIKQGDLVLTHTGNFRRVSKLIVQDYNGTIYSIYRKKDNIPINVTSEHPIYIATYHRRNDCKGNRINNREKYFKLRWDIPENITIRRDSLVTPRMEFGDKQYIELSDYVEYPVIDGIMSPNHRFPLYKKVTNKIQITSDFAYILGIMAADGSIAPATVKGKRRFTMITSAHHSSEEHIARKVADFFKGKIICRSENEIRTQSHSAIWAKFLYKVIGVGKDKHIPDFIWDCSEEIQKAFIQGAIDGDGNIYHGRNQYTTISSHLAYGIAQLLVNTGIYPFIWFDTKRQSYSLGWKENSNGFDIMQNDYITTKVQKIEKNHYQGKVYNLEVEADESYVTNRTIVHNCLSALEACASGCPIVTTNLAALQTTVGEYGILIDVDPDSMEYKRQFIEQVKRLMTDDKYWTYWSEKAKENIYDRQNKYGTIYWSWKAIAEEWNDYLLDKFNPVMERVPEIYTQANWQGIYANLNRLYQDSRIGQEYEFRIPDWHNKLVQYATGQKNIYEILEMVYSFKWMGNKSFIRSEIAKAGFAVTGLAAEGEDLIATFTRTEWLEIALQDVYNITGQTIDYPTALEAKGCWPLEFPFLAHYDVKRLKCVNEPLVSVILSCRNWLEERTKPTVATLQKRLEENPGMVEFIAVDDASSDDTNEFLSQHCDMLITMRSRRGLADVYNAGIKHSNAPYILILQNDVLLDTEDFFPRLVSVYENHPEIGLLTPFLKNNCQYELFPKTIVEDAFLYHRMLDPNNLDPIRVAVHPSICVLSLRDRFVQAGLYDPYQYLVWEDHDMCRKFDDNGYIMGVAKDVPVSLLEVENTFTDFDMPETIRRMAAYLYFCLKYNYSYSFSCLSEFLKGKGKEIF